MSSRQAIRIFAFVTCGSLLQACGLPFTPADQARSGSGTHFVEGRAAFYVVVERRQSLDGIAQTYRVMKQDIINANKLSAPYNLEKGAMLEIPLGPSHTATRAASRPLPRTLALFSPSATAIRRNAKRPTEGERHSLARVALSKHRVAKPAAHSLARTARNRNDQPKGTQNPKPRLYSWYLLDRYV